MCSSRLFMFKSRRYRGKRANEVKYVRKREWDCGVGKTNVAGRAQLWQFRGNYELKGGRSHSGWINASLKTYTKLDFQFPCLVDGTIVRCSTFVPSAPPSLFTRYPKLREKAPLRSALSGCNPFAGRIASAGKGWRRKESLYPLCDHSTLFTFSYTYRFSTISLSRRLAKLGEPRKNNSQIHFTAGDFANLRNHRVERRWISRLNNEFYWNSLIL